MKKTYIIPQTEEICQMPDALMVIGGGGSGSEPESDFPLEP